MNERDIDLEGAVRALQRELAKLRQARLTPVLVCYESDASAKPRRQRQPDRDTDFVPGRVWVVATAGDVLRDLRRQGKTSQGARRDSSKSRQHQQAIAHLAQLLNTPLRPGWVVYVHVQGGICTVNPIREKEVQRHIVR